MLDSIRPHTKAPISGHLRPTIEDSFAVTSFEDEALLNLLKGDATRHSGAGYLFVIETGTFEVRDK
jgi:hypothetical protein